MLAELIVNFERYFTFEFLFGYHYTDMDSKLFQGRAGLYTLSTPSNK